MSSGYKDRVYTVLPYDPQWANSFTRLAAKIKKIFGVDALDIQHIGSTSVPGMSGKPTIDVLVLVDSLEVAEAHAADMERAGFEYEGEFVMPDSRLFRMMNNNTLLANVHIFLQDHPHVLEMLGLRDYLRTHLEEVSAYSNLKIELYEKYRNEYANYRKDKDAYMAELKKRAAAYH
jgi:GrpB-like predicted nucleotidyltransferase (UPF0157 family)